ncbi:protein kinase domain-containing protein [Chondromyces apiculatus]|uniref:Protein kinase domain-containing protein n=1 Tax=Chondromyces apiculatus DSM 436 TaxID=1192034 RepID=A0A017SV44_9BACT|nr:protein kinase [Chondromyces apiculatus]EYF00617.1 Hypothetical protein CAP_0432 [Chondromyces apiculatus DSM 436]
MALERSPSGGSPSRLGNYELIKELSGGGAGSVWLARADAAAGGAASAPVTMFRLYRQLTKKAEIIESVLREAEAVLPVRAPNILPIEEARVVDGEVVVVSPYVEGEPLMAVMVAAGINETARGAAAVAAAQGMPLGVVLRIAADVLRALVATHGAEPSLMHGELSPQHVRIGVDGVTRVGGFGVARAVAPLVPMGSKSHERLAYAAPERVKAMASHGETPLKPAGDLFPVGVMLWELCAKQRLFASKLEAAIIQKVLTTPIPALSTMEGIEVPGIVDEVIQKALKRDPAQRYGSAEEMLAALEDAAGDLMAGAAEVAAALDKLSGKVIEARKTMITAALLGKGAGAAVSAGPTSRRRGATLVGVANPLAEGAGRGGAGSRVAITAPSPKAPAGGHAAAAEETGVRNAAGKTQPLDVPPEEGVDAAWGEDAPGRPRMGTLVGFSTPEATSAAVAAVTGASVRKGIDAPSPGGSRVHGGGEGVMGAGNKRAALASDAGAGAAARMVEEKAVEAQSTERSSATPVPAASTTRASTARASAPDLSARASAPDLSARASAPDLSARASAPDLATVRGSSPGAVTAGGASTISAGLVPSSEPERKEREGEAPISASPTTAKSNELARPGVPAAPKPLASKPTASRGSIRPGALGTKSAPLKPGFAPPPKAELPMARAMPARSDIPTAMAPLAIPSSTAEGLRAVEHVPPSSTAKPTPSSTPTSTTKHTPTGPQSVLKQRGRAASAVDRLGPGSTLGRYEILMPVAKGGMAAVWAARLQGTRGFQKIVAIKTMLPDVSDDPDFQTMFLDEARVAARIRHPNVVEILDLGEENDVLYLVMEWVEGETVGTLQKAAKALGGVPQRIALRIASQVCAGLQNAHELRDDNGTLLDLVHRDISPANVLISASGFVKIVDFGVAKSKGRLHVTRAGGIVKGKTPYLSPEQLGGLPLDRRSDIFSLGALLYVLATGLHPFRGETEMQTVENIALRNPIPPHELNKAIHPEFEKIILKALEKERAMRWSTCAEMQRALDQVATQLGQPTTDEDVAEFVREAMGSVLTKRAQELREAITTVDASAAESKPAASGGGSVEGAARTTSVGLVADNAETARKSAPAISNPDLLEEIQVEGEPEPSPQADLPRLVIAPSAQPPPLEPQAAAPAGDAHAASAPVGFVAPLRDGDATTPGRYLTEKDRRKKVQQRVVAGVGAAVLGVTLIALFAGGSDPHKTVAAETATPAQQAAPEPVPTPTPVPQVPEALAAPPSEPPPAVEEQAPTPEDGAAAAAKEPQAAAAAGADATTSKAPTAKAPATKATTTKAVTKAPATKATTKTPTTKAPTKTTTKKPGKPFNPTEI